MSLPNAPSVDGPPLAIEAPRLPERPIQVEHLVDYALEVTNEGERPVTLRLTVEGIDPGWIASMSPAIRLAASEAATLRVTLLAPRTPSSVAGLYNISLCLKASEFPLWSWRRESVVRVLPFDDLALRVACPVGSSSTARGGGEQLLRLWVANRGNEARQVVLKGEVQGEGCRVRVGPAGGTEGSDTSTSLFLRPGEEKSVEGAILYRRPLAGRSALLRDLSVTVTNRDGGTEYTSARVQVAIAPLFDVRLLAGFAGSLALLVLFLLVWPGSPDRLSMVSENAPRLAVVAGSFSATAIVPPGASHRDRESEPVSWNTLVAERSEQVPVAVPTLAIPVTVEEVRYLAEIVAPEPPSPPPSLALDSAPEGVPRSQLAPELLLPDMETPDRGDERYDTLIREVALHYNLDWRLLASIVYHESRFNPNAVGRDNEGGLMQIIPGTWDLVAPRVNVWDPFDPYSNLMAGAYYLTAMQKQFAERGFPEIYWALAAYNWGPVNLNRLLDEGGGWGDLPLDVQWYVWNILSEAASPSAAWWENELKQVAYPRQ